MKIIDERVEKSSIHAVNVGDVIIDMTNEMYLVICGLGLVERYDFAFGLIRLSDLTLWDATDGSLDDMIAYALENYIDIKEIVKKEKLAIKIS